MRPNIHHHYEQLTDEERDACDKAAQCVMDVLRMACVPRAGDDRAERMVDGIARLIIESRKD